MERSSRMKIASSVDLSDTVAAYWPTRALLTAMELDLFDALAGGPMSAEELSERLGTDPRATELLANAIAALGLLEKSSMGFALSEFAASHLIRGQGDYLGGLIEHHMRLWTAWSRLTDVVREGRPASELPPPGRAPEPPSGDTRSFICAMHTMGAYRAAKLAEAIDLTGVERIADVGGGPGDNAYAMLKRLPNASAVVFDLPDVVPIALEIARLEGVTERVEVRAGDYMKDDFPADVDLVLLSHVIHSNDIPTCEMVFRKAFASLNPGGQCAVHDFVLDDDATGPVWPAIFSLNMLVATRHGRSYTDAEIRGWLTNAGFTDICSAQVDPCVTAVIVGRKADR